MSDRVQRWSESITSVLIADDHPLFARALTLAAHAVDPALNVVTAATLAGAERAVQGDAFALVLLDLMLPDVEGFAGLQLLRSLTPSTPIAIVSSRDDLALMRHASRHGARGFLSKALTSEQMVAAIRVLLAGGQWFRDDVLTDTADDDETGRIIGRIATLTAAQVRILHALASGRQNKQIAYDLGLTEATVKSHLVGIFRKLGVANRTQAVMAMKLVDAKE